MSTERYLDHGIAVSTYAGPQVTEGSRRRWQITNEVTREYVTLSEGQWLLLCQAIRSATATPAFIDREV